MRGEDDLPVEIAFLAAIAASLGLYWIGVTAGNLLRLAGLV